jgi:uncharacterized protein YndB with AHSA1/START domain
MSPSVTATVELAARPEEVWDVVMDPARLRDWVTIHRSVRAPDGPLRAGDSFEQTMALAGRGFTVRWTVTGLERPRRAIWEGEGPLRSSARVGYELEPEADGNTRFHYQNSFELPGGLLGRLASRLAGKASFEREARRSLENLDRLFRGSRGPRGR